MGQAVSEDLGSWAKAAEQAAVLAVNRVDYRWTYDDPDGHREMLFRVASATREHEVYTVRVYVQDGQSRIWCACEGAFCGRKCWHMAAAGLRAGLLSMPATPKRSAA